MGYLFYINEKQSQINREFLTNALLVNASMEILKKSIESLVEKSIELEKEIEKLKK
jgi:cell division protein FtsB